MASDEDRRRSLAFWGGRVATSADRAATMAATKERLYADGQVYQGLGSYSRQPADKLAKRPDESQTNWEKRTAVHRRQAELQAQAEADREEWDAHREIVDNNVGTGTGLYGNSSPQSRAAALGNRGFGSGRDVPAQGDLAASALSLPGQARPLGMVEINEIIKQREAELRGQVPQRTTVPTASSGEGWTVTR